MKMRKMIATLLSGAMLVGLLAACGSKDNKPSTESKAPDSSQAPVTESKAPERTEPYRLGLMTSSYSATFQAAAKTVEAMCEAAGMELVTVEMAGYDDQGILTTYENLINLGVDGVVATTFSEGTIRILADLFEENEVDWFLSNRRISDETLKNYVYNCAHFVGNDYCAEEQIAYDIVKQLHEDHGVNNLAVIGLAQGDVNGDLRDKGIARACSDLGMKLLTETRGIADVADVTNAVEGIISSYPEVDGIFIVGGSVTYGALAGASQALANHDMTDKVSIAMVDIAAGMEEYMGEGKPLKIVAGGNLIFDRVLAAVSLANNANGVNTDKAPYVLNTRMMLICDPQDSVDYAEYYENPDVPLMSGSQWTDTLLGQDLDTIQAFVDNFTLAYAKSLRK